MIAKHLILEQDEGPSPIESTSDNESKLYLFGKDLPANGYRVTSRGVGVFDALRKRTVNHPVLRTLGAMNEKEAINSLVRNGYAVAIQYMPGAFSGRYGDGIVIASNEKVRLPENVVRNFSVEAVTPVFYFNGEKTKRLPFKEYMGQDLTADEQLVWDSVEMSLGEMPPNGVGYSEQPGAQYHDPDAEAQPADYQERGSPTVRGSEFPENQPKPPPKKPEPEPEPSRLVSTPARNVRSTERYESAAQVVQRLLD